MIAPPEPVIVALQFSPGEAIGSGTEVVPGSTVNAILSGFGTPGATIDPSRVQVNINGTNYPAASVVQVTGTNDFDVSFVIPASVAAGQQLPLVIFLDGLSSTPASLSIASAN